MPGNDTVRNQNVLGTVAGIALLAFALAYRFLPSFGGGSAPPQPPPAPPRVGTPMTVQPPQVTAPPPVAASVKPPETETGAPAEPVEPAPPPPPPPKAIAALLKKADKAFADGRWLEPKATSALALYQKVLEADKENAAAQAGIAKIHDGLLAQANEALDREDEGDSTRAIEQLASLPGTEKAEIDKLQSRLKLLEKVSPLLTKAADLLQQGHATTPEGENALSVYREVLKLDPGNKLATQGLVQVQHAYLERALGAAAQDDYSAADIILAEASSILPGSQELLDTRTRIEGIRRQRAMSVLAQANSALDSGNPDLAQQLAQKALALSPDLSGLAEFNERLRNARLYASYHPGQLITDRFVDRSGAAPTLIVIPTGSFTMGSPADEDGHRPNEEPQREVRIDTGFALGADEITVGQFRAFISDADYTTDAEKLGTSSVYDEETGRMIDRHGVSWRDDYLGEKADDSLPVLHVSWNDAQAYVKWLNVRTGKKYRLPSEAEFEYALRAGTQTRFEWGDGRPEKVYANVTGDGDRSPHLHRSWAKSFPRYNDGHWGPAPVGSYAPNKFGLQDIDGNVSEWIEDCWHDNYLRAPTDSRAWVNPGCAERVVRGASWGSAPEQSRSAYRLAAPSDTRSARVGIRIARDL